LRKIAIYMRPSSDPMCAGCESVLSQEVSKGQMRDDPSWGK
jgi:hypothetical protein